MNPINTSIGAAFIICSLASNLGMAQSKPQPQPVIQSTAPAPSTWPTETPLTPLAPPFPSQNQDMIVIPPAADSAPSTEPVINHENGFTYICGGVGKTEADKMKYDARQYDLMITFATQKGEYLANVNVDIMDTKGNAALATNCDAPIMLINFPKTGAYRIHAVTHGYALNRTVEIKAKQHSVKLVLLWPQQVVNPTQISLSRN